MTFNVPLSSLKEFSLSASKNPFFACSSVSSLKASMKPITGTLVFFSEVLQEKVNRISSEVKKSFMKKCLKQRSFNLNLFSLLYKLSSLICQSGLHHC